MQYVLSSIVVCVVGCVIYYMGFFVPSSIEAHKERNQEIIEKKIPLLKLILELQEFQPRLIELREQLNTEYFTRSKMKGIAQKLKNISNPVDKKVLQIQFDDLGEELAKNNPSPSEISYLESQIFKIYQKIASFISQNPELKEFESLKDFEQVKKTLDNFKDFEQVKKTLDNLEEVSSSDGVDFAEFNIFAWVGWLFTAGFILLVIFSIGIVFASGTFLSNINC